MPATHHIDREKKTVFVTVTGEVTLAELLEDRQRMRENPDFDPDFAFLMDLRDVTGMHISSAELRVMAAGSALSRTAKQAYVVPSDIVFGMARIYSVISKADPDAVQVFRDMESALAWLGLNADDDGKTQ